MSGYGAHVSGPRSVVSQHILHRPRYVSIDSVFQPHMAFPILDSIPCSVPGSVPHSTPVFRVSAYFEAFLLIVPGHLVPCLIVSHPASRPAIVFSLRGLDILLLFRFTFKPRLFSYTTRVLVKPGLAYCSLIVYSFIIFFICLDLLLFDMILIVLLMLIVCLTYGTVSV